MLRAVDSLLIACCVTHFNVLNFVQQSILSFYIFSISLLCY